MANRTKKEAEGEGTSAPVGIFYDSNSGRNPVPGDESLQDFSAGVHHRVMQLDVPDLPYFDPAGERPTVPRALGRTLKDEVVRQKEAATAREVDEFRADLSAACGG